MKASDLLKILRPDESDSALPQEHPGPQDHLHLNSISPSTPRQFTSRYASRRKDKPSP